MTRIAALSLLCALAAAPLAAQEEPDADLPLAERARATAAEAIGRVLTDPGNPGQAQVSPLVRSGEQILLCATTDARNRSGTYIGRDYWEVTLSSDGDRVERLRNVTGLLSPCYGADYQPFGRMLGQ